MIAGFRHGITGLSHYYLSLFADFSMYNYYGDPDKEFEEIQKLIIQYLDVESFNVSFRYQLRTLPPEIGEMKNLKELFITSCHRFQGFPSEVINLNILKRLQLSLGSQELLPKNLNLLKSVERLSLTYQSYTRKTDWKMLGDLVNLQSLDMSSSLTSLRSVPEIIKQLPELRFLYLANNNLRQLPDFFRELKTLQILDLSGNFFTKFPKPLVELTNLETLCINAQAIDCLPAELLAMPNLMVLRITGKDNRRFPNVALMEKLFLQTQKRCLSDAYKNFILEVLKQPQQIDQMDEAELLDVLNSDIEPLCVQALVVLERLLRERPDIKKPEAGCRVVFKGKIGGKKSQLKNRIKSLNLQTGVSLSKDTTHLVLGQFPDLTWRDLEKMPQLTLLTENMLLQYLNQLEMPYLLDENTADTSEEQVENIRALLHSHQDDNILLAFEILHGGGFPPELLSDIFLVYKETSNAKIRREALHFVNQFGPPEFGLAVKRRLSIFSRWTGEATICKNLRYYCEQGGLDKMRVLQHVYKKIGRGTSFALLHLSTAEKKAFFAEQLKDGILDLSNLELTELPSDLPLLGDIRVLRLSGNHFTELPSIVYHSLPSLRELELRSMPYLQQFPYSCLSIDSLELLIVSTNYKNMPSAKELQAAELKVEIKAGYKGYY